MFKTTTGKWFMVDYDLAVWGDKSDELCNAIEAAVTALPDDEQDALHSGLVSAGETGQWDDGGPVDRLVALVTKTVSELAKDWVDPSAAHCVTMYAEPGA